MPDQPDIHGVTEEERQERRIVPCQSENCYVCVRTLDQGEIAAMFLADGAGSWVVICQRCLERGLQRIAES